MCLKIKKLLLLLSLALIYFLESPAQGKLIIEIIDLRNNNGNVLLELRNDKEEIIHGFSEKINNHCCTISIDNLEPGTYAFKFFHDENEDEKINTNIVGIPKEGYGFSNNASGKFGPPSFNKTLFRFEQSDTIKCFPTYIQK